MCLSPKITIQICELKEEEKGAEQQQTHCVTAQKSVFAASSLLMTNYRVTDLSWFRSHEHWTQQQLDIFIVLLTTFNCSIII